MLAFRLTTLSIFGCLQSDRTRGALFLFARLPRVDGGELRGGDCRSLGACFVSNFPRHCLRAIDLVLRARFRGGRVLPFLFGVAKREQRLVGVDAPRTQKRQKGVFLGRHPAPRFYLVSRYLEVVRAKLRTKDERLLWLFRGLGAACAFFALVARTSLGPPLDAEFFAGLALWLAAPLFRKASVLREVGIEPEPGKISLEMPRIFGITERRSIFVREVNGASIAKTDRAHVIAIARGWRRAPLVLEMGSEADATRIRDALGISKRGFGTLTWNRAPRPLHTIAALLRVVDILLCLAVVLGVFLSDPFAATLDVQSAVTKIAIGLATFVLLTPPLTLRRTLTLAPDGVRVFESLPLTYPYRDIVDVRLAKNAIVLEIVRQNMGDSRSPPETVAIEIAPSRPLLEGISPTEAEAIVTQIRARAESAHAPAEPQTEATEVRALVARRPNEAMNAWVRRLDDMADSWRTSPPRHGEAIAFREALWAVVEDHDADQDLRELAARMLSRLDPDAAPDRIRVVATALRDPERANRLRIALEADAEPLVKSLEERARAR